MVIREKRNSSFEIMRLLAMFMIILGHCMLATAQNVQPYGEGIDNIGWGVKAFTICAVNLFFLLTGYFSVNSGFRISRIVNIWIKTMFYSVVIYIVIALVYQTFAVKDFLGYFFPILTKKYWFITTYVVVALLAPYANIMLEKLSDSHLNFLILVLLFFFSFHETFFKVVYTLDRTQGYGFIWACVMFCIGYWMRRHEMLIRRFNIKKYLCGYCLFCLAIFISNLLIVKLNIAGGIESRGNFYAYNSLTVFIQSVCLFCCFIKLASSIPVMPMINSLGRNSLEGYLISSHPLLLFPLWHDYLAVDRFVDTPILYLLISIAYSLMILLICIFIGKIVDYGFGRVGLKSMLKKIDDFYEEHTK